MAKVNKTYSLDYETIELIESHTYNGELSRSGLVNSAIKWYLTGDIAELKAERDDLRIQFAKLVNEKHFPVAKKSKVTWWKRLLGLN